MGNTGRLLLKAMFARLGKVPMYHIHKYTKGNLLTTTKKKQKREYQMKEQDQTPEEKVSEVKRDNLSEQVFRVMIIKMIKELGRRMDAHSEKLEDLTNREEKNRDETNMKNTIEGIKIRLYDTEEQISEWKKGSDNHCR